MIPAEEEQKEIREYTQKEKDDILDVLYETMHSELKLSDVRVLCEMTDYDRDKILDAYEYMMGYSNEIDVPIAFMKATIKNGYKKPEKKVVRKNSFTNFEQTVIDFDALEKVLVDN